ncbi:hypothetical protein D3C76_151420 [compost metagenome]
MCILAREDRSDRFTNEHFAVQPVFDIFHSFIISLNSCRYVRVIMLTLQRAMSQEIQFDISEAKALKLVEEIIHPHLRSRMRQIQRIGPVQCRQRLACSIFEDNIAIRILVIGAFYRLAHIIAPVYKRCPVDPRMLAIAFNDGYGICKLLIIQIIPVRVHVDEHIAVIVELLQMLLEIIGDIHHVLIRQRAFISAPAVPADRYALRQLRAQLQRRCDNGISLAVFLETGAVIAESSHHNQRRGHFRARQAAVRLAISGHIAGCTAIDRQLIELVCGAFPVNTGLPGVMSHGTEHKSAAGRVIEHSSHLIAGIRPVHGLGFIADPGIVVKRHRQHPVICAGTDIHPIRTFHSNRRHIISLDRRIAGCIEAGQEIRAVLIELVDLLQRGLTCRGMDKSQLDPFAESVLNLHGCTGAGMTLIAFALDKSASELDAAVDSLQLLSVSPAVTGVPGLSIQGDLIRAARYQQAVGIIGNRDRPVAVRFSCSPEIVSLFTRILRPGVHRRLDDNPVNIRRIPVAVSKSNSILSFVQRQCKLIRAYSIPVRSLWQFIILLGAAIGPDIEAPRVAGNIGYRDPVIPCHRGGYLVEGQGTAAIQIAYLLAAGSVRAVRNPGLAGQPVTWSFCFIADRERNHFDLVHIRGVPVMVRESDRVQARLQYRLRIISSYRVPAGRLRQINHLVRTIVHLHIYRPRIAGNIRYPNQIGSGCRNSDIRKLQGAVLEQIRYLLAAGADTAVCHLGIPCHDIPGRFSLNHGSVQILVPVAFAGTRINSGQSADHNLVDVR